MKKRITSLFLLLFTLVNIFPITAFARHQFGNEFIAMHEHVLQHMRKSDISLIVIFIILTTVIFVVVLNAYPKSKQLRKELNTNPNLPEALYKKLVPNYLTPAEFVCLFCENYLIWYFVCIAELVNQRVVKMGPHYEYVAYPMEYENNYILDVLEQCREYTQKRGMPTDCENGCWLLPVKYLNIFFEKKKNCWNLYRLQKDKETDIGIKMFNRQHKEFGKLYRKMFVLYEYILKKDDTLIGEVLFHITRKGNNIPVVEFSDVVKNYYYYSYHVLYYCLQTKNEEIDGNRDNSFHFTFMALHLYRRFRPRTTG